MKSGLGAAGSAPPAPHFSRGDFGARPSPGAAAAGAQRWQCCDTLGCHPASSRGVEGLAQLLTEL